MSRFIYCYAECHYAECRYAECRKAECRYAECRGAVYKQVNDQPYLNSLDKWPGFVPYLWWHPCLDLKY